MLQASRQVKSRDKVSSSCNSVRRLSMMAELTDISHGRGAKIIEPDE
jgi:hypothetical protein